MITTYIGTIYESHEISFAISRDKETADETIEYIHAGNQRVAMKSSKDGVFYFHPDHLGSTNKISNAQGFEERRTCYTPFGSVFSTGGGKDNDYKFTGQRSDDPTGLYYYGARYYDPELGIFLTPDTIVQSPYDPQTLNRYAYCRDNPIIYTDPTGHSWESDLFINVFGNAYGLMLTVATGGSCGFFVWAENGKISFIGWAGSYGAAGQFDSDGNWDASITGGFGHEGRKQDDNHSGNGGSLPGSMSLYQPPTTIQPWWEGNGGNSGAIDEAVALGIDMQQLVTEEAIGRGEGELGTPYKFPETDCTWFISQAYGTRKYGTREFEKNPSFIQVSPPPMRGDVIIWKGNSKTTGAYSGHAAIWTGEGGKNALLHNHSYRKYESCVSYTPNYVDRYYQNNFFNIDVSYYRYQK